MTAWDAWMTARDSDARKHVKTGLKYLSCVSCDESGDVKMLWSTSSSAFAIG